MVVQSVREEKKKRAIARKQRAKDFKKRKLLRDDITYYVDVSYRFKLVTDVWKSKKIITTLDISRKIIKNDKDVEEIIKGYVYSIHVKYDENVQFVFNHIKFQVATEAQKQSLSKVKMFGTKLIYSLLGDTREMNPTELRCVEDYVWYHIRDVQETKGRLKGWTRLKLRQILGDEPTTENVLDCVHQIGHCSMYAFSPMGDLVESHICPRDSMVLFCLVYVINNNHLYPVLDDQIKNSAIRKSPPNIQLQKYDFDISYNNYCYLCDEQEFDVEEEDYEHQVVLVDTDDLKGIAIEITQHTNLIIDQFQMNRGKLVAFVHPAINNIFTTASQLSDRRRVCNTIYDHIAFTDEFVWSNQSWGKLSTTLLEQKFIRLPESNLNDFVWCALDMNPVAPLIDCLSEDATPPRGAKTYDKVKSYASAMRDNKYQYPVFSIYDEIREYQDKDIEVGEYEIPTVKVRSITIKGGFKPHGLVIELLNRNVITKKDITRCIIASFKLDKHLFKEYVELCFDKFKAEGKHMCNHLNGSLGQKCKRFDRGCITDSLEVCQSILIHEATELHNKPTFEQLGGLYFIHSANEKPLYKTHYPIYRHNIANGIINLLELQDAVVPVGKDNIVHSYNTDSITVVPARGHKIRTTDDKLALGQIRIEPDVKMGRHTQVYDFDRVPDMDEHYTEWNKDTYKFKENGCVDLPDDFLAWGMFGGECKSRTLQALYHHLKNVQDNLCEHYSQRGKKVLVLTFQNAPRRNLKQNGVECSTFDSFFHDEKDSTTVQHYDYIMIDEWDATPVAWKTKVYYLKLQYPHIHFQGYGCPNQCPSVEIGRKPFNSVDFQCTKDIFDNKLIEFKYCEEFGRFDPPLYKQLKNLYNTKLLKPEDFNKIDFDLDINICKNNDFRLKHNYDKCMIRPTGVMIGDINYNIDMPVICNINNKGEDLVNTQFFYIVSIDTDAKEITLSDKDDTSSMRTIAFERFRSSKDGSTSNDFELAFYFTVCKCQSITIKDRFNIHQSESMTYEELNTALSRAKELSDIHCEPKRQLYKRYWYNPNPMLIEGTMKEGGKRYNNSKIYQVKYEGEIVYVGETTKKHLKDRLAEHKRDSKGSKDSLCEWLRFIKAIGYHKQRELEIELIEEYPCKCKTELVTRERYWIAEREKEGCILHNSINRPNLKFRESKFDIKKHLFEENDKIKIKFTYIHNEFKLQFTDPVTKKKVKRGYKKKGKDVVVAEILEQYNAVEG